MWMDVVPWEVAWPCAIVLGAAASSGSSSAVDLLSERYHDAATHLLPMLRRTTRLSNALAILTFGLVFCIWRVSEGSLDVPERGRARHHLESVVTLGLLFFLFIGKDQSANKAFLSMVGILVIFASGAAFFLQLSALAVNLILGVDPGPDPPRWTPGRAARANAATRDPDSAHLRRCTVDALRPSPPLSC